MEKKVILIILDGWGETQNPDVSAIYKAKTPYFDSLISNYPNASLRTDGLHVGLPEGQMGNSEVGHMNLGAGRIVYQDFVKINNAVADGTMAKEKVITDAFNYAKTEGKKVHLTWAGHDFLDAIKDQGIWDQTKTKLKEVGGPASLDVVKAVAVSIMTSALGLGG